MRHLKAFHVFHIAASSSSYTQAAEQLNLTHGAVSKQIKTLEQYLDKRLFHKQGRNVVLTEEGQLLKSYTEQAFGALSAGVAKLNSLDAHSLEVSCEPTLTMRWLMPKLDEFYSQTGTDVAYPRLAAQLISSIRGWMSRFVVMISRSRRTIR